MAARLDLEISPIKLRNPSPEDGIRRRRDRRRYNEAFGPFLHADIMRDKKPLQVERATGLSCPVDSCWRLFQSLSPAIFRFGTHAVDVLLCINSNDE
jgi:hypothetical protein